MSLANPYSTHFAQNQKETMSPSIKSHSEDDLKTTDNIERYSYQLTHSYYGSQDQYWFENKAEMSFFTHHTRFFTCVLNVILLLPCVVARLVSFLAVWFTLAFSQKSKTDLVNSSLPSASFVSSTYESISTKNDFDVLTASKHGVDPTHQQTSVKPHKFSDTLFFILTIWIPFTFFFGNDTLATSKVANSVNEFDQHTARDFQSPYNTLEPCTESDLVSNESPSQDPFKPSSVTVSDESETTHDNNCSVDLSTTSNKSFLTHFSSPFTESFKGLPTSSKQKSPISYAFRFPRIYAPPRPLLPHLIHNSISIWDLFSSKKSKTAMVIVWSTEDEIPKPKTTHSRTSSSAGNSPDKDTYFPNPLSVSKIRISSNANAIHNRRLKKKTLVLDLDETLIHSLSKAPGFSQGHMIEVKFHSQLTTLYTVLKRPFCEEFLDQVSQWYNLVVFTASIQAYADPMIDWLEQDRKYFAQRFYRQHCTQTSLGYVKDLAIVDSDMSNVMIIDNSPISYTHNESNGIGIEGWINDPSDTSLMALIPFLSALRFTTDVRSIIGLKSDQAFQA